ncbi:methionyl-tRNA formyltransferase, partial [Myxococcus xanthus]|nr:methionyl-tRNA formyltransferase [Myxococcus xanthus]
EPDAAPIVAYGGLIPPSVLAIPRHGWINLHFSLLPAWRGAAPVQHALMAGDDVTGASTFLLEEGLDTGPVFGTMTEAISPTDTSGDLLTRLAEGGASLLVSTLDALATGDVTPIPQPRDGVSLAPK